MKTYYYIFWLVLVQSTCVFSQKQLTNFVYPTIEQQQNYEFFKSDNDKNYVWFQNQTGVYCLDITLKQTAKIMLYDSVSAQTIESHFVDKNGNGTIVLKDSLENHYICTSRGTNIKIHFALYKPFSSNNVNPTPKIYHDKNRLLFFNENTLYELKNNEIILLDIFRKPIFLTANDKNWAAINKDSLNYNGIKKPLNPYLVERNIIFYPIFGKNALYLYTTNKIWKFDERRNRMDSVQSFKRPIGLFSRNDSLFIEEYLSDLYPTRNLYYFDNDKITFLKNYFTPGYNYEFILSKWEDTNLKIQAYTYYGTNISFEDKRLKKYTILTIFPRNINFWYPELNLIQKTDSSYLFHLKSAIKSFYIISKLRKDTTTIEVFEEVKQLNDSLILAGNKNLLRILNLKTLSATFFLTYPKNYVYTTILPDFNRFVVGKKNLAYVRGYGQFELIQDFRNNKVPILITEKGTYSPDRHYFINDSIVIIPQNKFSGSDVYLLGKQDLYISLGITRDSLRLYEVSTRKYLFIKMNPDDNFQRICVVGNGEIIIVYLEKLVLWKNGVFSVLKENVSVDIVNDKVGNPWFFLKKNNNAQVEIAYFSNGQLVLKYLIDSPKFSSFSINPVGNDFFIIGTSDNSRFVFKLSTNGVSDIPTFWRGSPNSFWADNKENIYCLARDNDDKIKIFSSKSPKKPIIDFFPKSIDSNINYSVVNQNDDIYFTSYLNDRTAIVKYVKSANKYYYINDVNVFGYWLFKDKIIFEGKRNNERYICEINENGEKQFNIKPINNLGNINFADTGLYVIGNIKAGTRQIFELASKDAVNANFKWIPLESGQEDAQIDAFGKVIAYPNPFSDKINFSFHDVPGINHVGIYDMSGSKILFDFAPNFLKPYFEQYQPASEILLQKNKRTYLSELLEAQLVRLPAGIYLVKFYLDEYFWNKAITVRVVKQ